MYSGNRISDVKPECNLYKDEFIFVDISRNETQTIRHPKEKWNFQKTIIKFNNITATDSDIYRKLYRLLNYILKKINQ